MNHFDLNFFIGCYFHDLFGMELKRRPLNIIQGSKFSYIRAHGWRPVLYPKSEYDVGIRSAVAVAEHKT